MNLVTALLIVLVFVANLVFAQPSLADKPKFLKNPDYIEVTKALNDLKTAQEAQAQSENYNPEEIQQKIGELEFQKYALETGINWGQCRNETGKTLAVYGPKPDLDDDDYESQYDTGLYFLADGQTTKKKWDCEGVYLPSDAQIAGLGSEELAGPVAVKVADGTQIAIKTNADTGAIEFSNPPTKVFKAGDVNWFIPNVSQSAIDTRVANAPTAKKSQGNDLVVVRNLEKDTTEPSVSPQAQPQPKPPVQEQRETQPEVQSNGSKGGYYNKKF
ncbi:MAG TPA: hypothetical protein V6C85_18280 [Allocoleopsis sp.]